MLRGKAASVAPRAGPEAVNNDGADGDAPQWMLIWKLSRNMPE